MSLAAGTRFGLYVIETPIGAGGMGEVYRARDTRLNRDVAVKVLPDLFANDPDRLARFEREAQVLASLNHPNIAHIYGIEDSGGIRALVMELVEGPTLADMIAAPASSVRSEAAAIAGQIAAALEAAHEQGIIHRDLKPANIKVRPDGTVKVLDFGLAVAHGADPGSTMNSPTILQATGIGVILGTAAYMSPEQARGRPVDKRSDIWAFGVVLHEMLTGTRLFDGETMVETLGLVATRDPHLSPLPADTPEHLRTLLRRCLERDPKKRLRDIGEARILLDAPPVEAGASKTATAGPNSLSWRHLAAWFGSLVLVGAATGAVAWRLASSSPASPPLRRFTIPAPNNARVTAAAISPDSRIVAFISRDRVWLRRLDEVESHEIQGSEGAHAVFWSPDSAFFAFETRGQLWKAAVSGGSPTTICPVPQAFSPSGGVAWLDDGRIVFTTGGSGLLEVSAQGGTPRPLLEPDRPTEIDFHDATPLPGGRGVLFIPHRQGGAETLELFDGRTRREVLSTNAGIADPTYAPSGHILFEQDGSVWAVPFSLADAKTTGAPFVVAQRASNPTVSADGTLVATPGTSAADAQLAWMDREGRALGTVGRRGHAPNGGRLSPDGRRLAGTIEASGNVDVWIVDVATGGEMRLTFESDSDTQPAWSPDGQTIVYQCGSNICARAADGTGSRRVILERASSPAVSPDGRWLVFGRSGETTGPDLWTAPLTVGPPLAVAEPEAKPFMAIDGPQRSPVFSTDGRFLSYESFTAPSWSVFVTKFPSGDGRWEVVNGIGTGGGSVRWSVKGDQLHFLDRASDLVEMDISTAPAFTAGARRLLNRIPAAGRFRSSTFERSLDGTRFLVVLSNAEPGTESRVIVVENWTAGLR